MDITSIEFAELVEAQSNGVIKYIFDSSGNVKDVQINNYSLAAENCMGAGVPLFPLDALIILAIQLYLDMEMARDRALRIKS